MNHECQASIESERTRHYLGRLTAVQAALLSAAALAYPGDYSLSENALSDLGCWITPDGQCNQYAAALFATAMLTTAALLIALIHALPRRQSRARVMFLSFSAAGAILILMPHTVQRIIHGIGAGLLIGGFWGYSLCLSIRAWRAHHRVAAVTCQMVVQGAVLTYALLFAADSPGKQVAQKMATLGLGIGIRGILGALSRREESDILAEQCDARQNTLRRSSSDREYETPLHVFASSRCSRKPPSGDWAWFPPRPATARPPWFPHGSMRPAGPPHG